MSKRTSVAMGLRVHSGWAALVVVGGDARAPSVIERRRIVIFDATIAGSKQPFHAAEKMPFEKAKAHIARCRASTWKMAREAIGAVIEEMRDNGHTVGGCGLLLASGRPVGTLAASLASHTMLHTSEGQFFRDALREASEHFGVAVMGVSEKELFARAAETLRMGENEIRRRIATMGKTIGPPWSQDEKLAAVVGWMVLKAGARGRGSGNCKSRRYAPGEEKAAFGREEGASRRRSFCCRSFPSASLEMKSSDPLQGTAKVGRSPFGRLRAQQAAPLQQARRTGYKQKKRSFASLGMTQQSGVKPPHSKTTHRLQACATAQPRVAALQVAAKGCHSKGEEGSTVRTGRKFQI